MKRAAVAFMAGILGAAVAQAAPELYFNSFENLNNGWGGVTGYSTTTGVTHGNYAAKVVVNSGWRNGPLRTGWSADILKYLNGDDEITGGIKTVSIDVTPANTIPAGCSLQIAWQFQQNPGADTADIGYTAVNPTGTTTITYNYAPSFFPDTGIIGTPGAWANISIITNSAGINPSTGATWIPGDFYFDNFRIGSVPEPVTLAGLLAFGLIVLRRNT